MPLLLLVLAYVSVVFASVGALVLLHHRRMGVPRALLWCVVVGLMVFMLQAPACVYLPQAPGQPAVERFLLGSDASQTLYWLEGRSEVAFIWGPRWYLRVGHVFEAGIEFVPPLRYARRDRTIWEVVNSRGERSPYPARLGNPRYQYGALDLVKASGAVLSWHRDGLHQLEPGDSTSRVLAPIDFDGSLEATCLFPGERPVEVYQDFTTFQKSRGRTRALLLIERNPDGRERRRGSFSLPEDGEGHRMHHRLRCSGTADRPLLIEVWAPGTAGERGCVYGVASGLDSVILLSRFDVVLSEHVPLSIAVSGDGELLTTGQAVWHTTGGKIRDLDAPLRSCVWIGRTLYGIRAYPFLFQKTLSRDRKISVALAAARGEIGDSNPIGARRFEPYREAWARGRWVLGGLDEADRQDEIVSLEIQ